MRVLLVQSHLGRIQYSPPLFPIGLCYVATGLTKHTVKIIDLNIWELPLAYNMLEKELSEFNPDVVGISIRNIDTTYRFDVFYHFKTIRPTAQLIKKHNPDITLLVGGPGFSLFAQKIMERVPEFNFGIYLEGEESVAELLDNLNSPETVKGIFIRKNGAVQFTGQRQFQDFDTVATPKRDSDLINIKDYIGHMHDN
ncbi:cobalamin-dependent protein, partial [Planctomycetota bacterium]